MSKEDYIRYVQDNLPYTWNAVLTRYGVKESAIRDIAEFCYKYKLNEKQLRDHLYSNDLICAAKWPEPELDFWCKLNDEVNQIEVVL